MEYGGWISEYNRYGVEAHLAPLDSRPGRVASGGANDMFLLLAIDCAVGAAELGRGAGLHFDEHNRTPIACDDIDLGVSARPVIPRNYGKSRTPQIAVREIFSAPAKSGFGRQCLAFAKLPCFVAQLPEQLPWVDAAGTFLTASSCHSITLPRMR